MFHIELIIEFLENVMNNIVQVAILFFEFVGVIVIILSGLKGFYNYVRRVPDMEGDRYRSRYHRTSCGTDFPDPLGDQGREESFLKIGS